MSPDLKRRPRDLRVCRALGLALVGVAGVVASLQSAHQTAAVVATVQTSSRPTHIAVDTLTNRVYVSLLFSAMVQVIDGTTNTVIDAFPVADRPSGLAVNPLTRRLYVSHSLTGQAGANTVEVLDEDDGSVLASVFVGGGPEYLRVNTITNEVYVGQSYGSDIVVIAGATNDVVATIPIGSGSHGIDIDEASNTIYATGRIGGTLSIIDGASHTVTDRVMLGGHPWAVAVNPARRRVYVTKDSLFVPGNTVTIVDQVTHAVLSTLDVGDRPLGIAVNPPSSRVYISHVGSSDIYILDADDESIRQVLPSSGSAPFGIGINLSTDRVFVANAYSNTVSVIGDCADRAPPSLVVSLSPSVLSPQNRAMRVVDANISVSDDCDPSPRVILRSITATGPDIPNPPAGPLSGPDIQGASLGTDDRQFQLRAEIDGDGTSRVYTVTFQAQDTSGKTTISSGLVTVQTSP